MAQSILVTGAGPTGVTGRLIKEHLLEAGYDVLSPSSRELDLTNDEAVSLYFDEHQIDYVVHCATFRSNINKTEHFVDEELESNLRMYFSLAAQSDKFKRMIYFGSGAEFDKSKDIVNVKEEEFGRSIPKNKYGLGKYIMNQHCRKSENIYNLRLFGTLNPYERYTKNVVCNLCAKAVMGLPLTLRQDCKFSWVDIEDVYSILIRVLTADLHHRDYNVALGQSYLLSEVAFIINNISKSNNQLMVDVKELNKEYTTSNSRIVDELNPSFQPIEQSISRIYHYWQSHKADIDVDAIDNRWKK